MFQFLCEDMMNLTISQLIIKSYLFRSPIISSSPSRSLFDTNILRVQAKHLFSPFYFSTNSDSSIKMDQSIFLNSERSIIDINSDVVFNFSDQQLNSHQDIIDSVVSPVLNITRCVFYNIYEQVKPGGALYVSNKFMNLFIKDSIFKNCITIGSGFISKRYSPVGGGAIAFKGSDFNLNNSQISRCSSKFDAMTFALSIFFKKSVKIQSSLLFSNGADSSASSLFVIDGGSTEIRSLNITSNKMTDRYAAGYIGWGSIASMITDSIISNNIGKSIILCCTNPINSGAIYKDTIFIQNRATKYGLLVRGSGFTLCEQCQFLKNSGNLFYGMSRLVLRKCVFDVPASQGNRWKAEFEEDNFFAG